MLVTFHISVAGIAHALLALVRVRDFEKLELDPVLLAVLLLLFGYTLLMERLLDALAQVDDLLSLVLQLPLIGGRRILHVAILTKHLLDLFADCSVLLHHHFGEYLLFLNVKIFQHPVCHFTLVLRLRIEFSEFFKLLRFILSP